MFRKANWKIGLSVLKTVVHGVKYSVHAVKYSVHAVEYSVHAVKQRLHFAFRNFILRISEVLTLLFRTLRSRPSCLHPRCCACSRRLHSMGRAGCADFHGTSFRNHHSGNIICHFFHIFMFFRKKCLYLQLIRKMLIRESDLCLLPEIMNSQIQTYKYPYRP